MEFVPDITPETGNPALELHIQQQLEKVSSTLQEVASIHFVQHSTVPDKYSTGDLYWFTANVVGLVAGLYFWDGAKWWYAGNYPAARGALYSNTSTNLTVATTDTIIKPYVTQSASNVDVDQDITNGTLTIQRDGVYFAQGFVDFLNPAPNQTYSIVFYKNGVEAPLTRTRATIKDNNDGVNLQTVIVTPLVAGDVIDLRMTKSTAGTISILSKLFSVISQ